MDATRENQICIALTPVGIIIGKYCEGGLVDARAASFEKKGGTINVVFQNLIGDPGFFYLGATPYYFTEDKELNNLYMEEISMIKVVGAMPKVDTTKH